MEDTLHHTWTHNHRPYCWCLSTLTLLISPVCKRFTLRRPTESHLVEQRPPEARSAPPTDEPLRRPRETPGEVRPTAERPRHPLV